MSMPPEMLDKANRLEVAIDTLIARKRELEVVNAELLDALKAIADDEGQVCSRCEGNGKLWADGQAHYPSEGLPTVNCGRCGGEGRIFSDLKQVAADAIAKAEGGAK